MLKEENATLEPVASIVPHRPSSNAPIPSPLSFLLFIYLITLYIRPQDWVSFMLGWPVDYIVFALLLGGSIFQLEAWQRIFSLPLFYLLLVWLAIIVLSNLAQGGDGAWYARLAFIEYGKSILISMCLFLFLNSTGQMRRLIWFQIFLSGVLAYQCMDQVANGVGWAGQPLGWDDGLGGRAQWVGMWDGMGVLALLFVVAFPFLIQFMFPPWNPVIRIISLLFSILIFQGLVLTQSRGGMLASGVALFASLILRFKPRTALIMGAIVVILGAPFLGFLTSRGFDDSDGSKSASHRVELWAAGLDMAKEHPVFGVGKTRFRHNAREKTGLALIAHNSYVENLGETGIPGLFVYVALAYLSIKGLWHVSKNVSDPKDRSLALALLASICSYAGSSMFVTTDFILFYLQLGFAAAFCSLNGYHPMLTWKDVFWIVLLEIGFVLFLQLFTVLFMSGAFS
ncbi:MAG: O-antigen ligase family protein [Nitrospirota bacterium]